MILACDSENGKDGTRCGWQIPGDDKLPRGLSYGQLPYSTLLEARLRR